jgi:hypothetical protein
MAGDRQDMSALIKIKTTMKKSSVLKNGYKETRARFGALLYRISPVLFARYRFRVIKGGSLNLKYPKSFDEKLMWLMLYWQHPLKSQCADKYAMREYVRGHGLEHMLPELLGVYENSDEINFDALPERFCLKCTHGCGFNIICRNKNEMDVGEAKNNLDAWLKKDFSKVYGEIHYAPIKPRIVCEAYLGGRNGNLPDDYKVFCFHGKAYFTMVCTERKLNGYGAKYDYYDREWEHKLPYGKSGTDTGRMLPIPEAYDEMIKAAEILSKPFPFVRMDFYCIDGKAIIGEMTFTPAGCIDPGYTDAAQRSMGELIQLPEKYVNVSNA